MLALSEGSRTTGGVAGLGGDAGETEISGPGRLSKGPSEALSRCQAGHSSTYLSLAGTRRLRACSARRTETSAEIDGLRRSQGRHIL